MIWRVFNFIFITLFSLVFPLVASATSENIVINSYKIAASGKSTDEFVEIYNSSSTTTNLNGWQLAKKTASGTKYNLVTSFPEARINPGESIIVAHRDSTEAADLFYSTDYSISEDNTIILFSDAGKTVADKVGFGKAGDFEGRPAIAAGFEVWTRKNGLDTQNNENDFKKAILTVDLSGLAISELMPSPESGEEWIEIYNSEIAKDIGGLVISDKLGTIKKVYSPKRNTNIRKRLFGI